MGVEPSAKDFFVLDFACKVRLGFAVAVCPAGFGGGVDAGCATVVDGCVVGEEGVAEEGTLVFGH